MNKKIKVLFISAILFTLWVIFWIVVPLILSIQFLSNIAIGVYIAMLFVAAVQLVFIIMVSSRKFRKQAAIVVSVTSFIVLLYPLFIALLEYFSQFGGKAGMETFVCTGIVFVFWIILGVRARQGLPSEWGDSINEKTIEG